MILLLDAGNSRLKWGLWRAAGWQARGALGLDAIDDLPRQVNAALHGAGPTGGVVCCVAGKAVRMRLESWLNGLAVPVHWLRASARGHGLVNRYHVPETLGADRFAALVGAWRNAFAPCVVVAAGTALTVDALNANGEFLGGLILPGRRLMHSALSGGTAGVQVALDAEACPTDAFPCSTQAAVAAGILAGAAGAVSTLQARLQAHVSGPVRVLLTGGDADWLVPALGEGVLRFEGLVLEGMRWIAHDLNWPGS